MQILFLRVRCLEATNTVVDNEREITTGGYAFAAFLEYLKVPDC